MHLPTVMLAILSFTAISVLGDDGDPNLCNDNDPTYKCVPWTGGTPAAGSITFCDQLNQKGDCTSPTMWEEDQCLFITDSDTKGGPGSSFQVTGDGGVCKLFTNNSCGEYNSGNWENSFNNPVKANRHYRTFKCHSAMGILGAKGRQQYDATEQS